jgi:alkylation response protein AidB-like acyl-CoA dehydrogenase
MDFSLPEDIMDEKRRFEEYLEDKLAPRLPEWYRVGEIPRSLFEEMGRNEWLAFNDKEGGLREQSSLKQSVLQESLARLSPGVAVAVVVQISLGTKGLTLFGSEELKEKHLKSAVSGDTLICLGNTEPTAGSDVANVAARADKVDGGWVLNGTKAFVTNGAISDFAVVTAVTDPDAARNKRLSMFLVDLQSRGVSRKKLNKQVWIPSDLTRLSFKDVFVPSEYLVGERGKGLQQVLSIFTHSRISISAMTLGTAVGAFDLGLAHARRREVFGLKLADFQAKSFEMADFFSRIEAARLMLLKACWAKDEGRDFRLEASMAKYLSVEAARSVSVWAADLFGAASVMFEHPIHKFPMDAWASSLGEGTQDVQKLIIFRSLMKKEGES